VAWRHLSWSEAVQRRQARRERQKARQAVQAGPRQATGFGRGWRARCQVVRLAQGNCCRRCGVQGAGFHVDHILPRRLWPSAETANVSENLSLLCPACHGHKTARIEPTLYGGDPSLLLAHLTLLARSGPVPSPRDLGDALARVRQHVESV
jgi:5-methylcytosine-specific restriction endonuclease McrA